MRTPVVLHALSSFDDTILVHTASSIIAGLSACLASPTPLRNEITNSPDFWSILQRLHTHKTEAEHVFEILANVAASEPSAVTADNYEATVSLANDFAAMGSIGAVVEQRKENPNRRRQPQQQRGKAPVQAQNQTQTDKETPDKPSEETVIVQRALKALSLIYGLSSLTPSFIRQSHLDHNEAWAAYWSPIFRALCAQCINPCREIRRRAVSALQRVLLSEDLAQTSSPTTKKLARSESNESTKTEDDDDVEKAEVKQEWTSLFTEVLFPLILRLLKPEVYQLDAAGMGETRVQCATVLTKIFLRYLDLLAGLPPMIVEVSTTSTETADEQTNQPAIVKEERPWLLDIWTKTLQLLDRLMNAGMGQREQEVMTEAVSEGLKNCCLVMAGGGYLVRPGDARYEKTKQKEILWRETMRRVERVAPGLWGELFVETEEGGVEKDGKVEADNGKDEAGEAKVEGEGETGVE